MGDILKKLFSLAKSVFPYILIIFIVYVFSTENLKLKNTVSPQTNIDKCTIHAFDENKNEEVATLHGKKLLRDLTSNAVTLYECKGVLHSDTSETTVKADEAYLDNTGKMITFKGNVVLHALNNDTYLYTSELFYNVKKAKIYTPKNVIIDEPDKTTYGKGLEANVRIKKVRILNNVRIVMKEKKEKKGEK
jgi:LPS export ABC transporter protein LptC